jgi:hypothetical protein
MDYQTLKTREKINGYNNRIEQLEAEHFSNEVYAFEASLIGEEASVAAFKEKNKSVEVRLEGLTAERDRLSELLENDSEGNNGGNTK